MLTESLGYMEGSFKLLTDSLEKYLIDKGCIFKYNTEIKNVNKNGDKWIINKDEYDVILSTVAYSITEGLFSKYLNKNEKNILNNVKYTAARTMMILLKEPLTDFYWLNIGENDIPFGGVIEHTNLVSKSQYNSNNIVYISNYMYEDEKMYKISKEELLNIYEPYLKKISDKFDKNNVINFEVYDELYAQPIIEKNYSEKMLDFKLNEHGLYLATMPQIYPEDRGMNYAIKIGYEVSKKIIDENI